MKKQYLILIIFVILALTGCSLFGSTGNDTTLPTTIPVIPPDKVTPENSPTPTMKGDTGREETGLPTPTAAGTQSTDNPEPAKDGKPTEPVTTLSPSPTVSPAPVEEKMTADKAKKTLESIVGTAYEVSQPADTIINGRNYYIFTVSDTNHIYTPDIIISADDGHVYWFFSEDEITELTSFPLDNAEAGQTPEAGFTKDDAIRLLETLSAEELSLPEKISEYVLSVDDWPTMIRGEECYGINAYADLGERKQLMGVFYVTMDGSSVYRNDMEEFILIH